MCIYVQNNVHIDHKKNSFAHYDELKYAFSNYGPNQVFLLYINTLVNALLQLFFLQIK